MRVNTRYTNSTRGTSSQSNGEKTKVTRLLEQDKSCPLFPPTPFNLATSQAHSLTVPKASAFSSTAHCPWKTTLAKPPNSVTTSFAELPPSGSIFPLRLQIYSPPHSFCHAATPAVLSSLFCLLTVSVAFHAFTKKEKET